MRSQSFNPLQYPIGRENPYPQLARHIHGKVTKTAGDYWLISGYEECRQVLFDTTNLSVKCRNKVLPYLLGMDPPKHPQARKRVAKLFSKETVQDLSTFSQKLSRETLSKANDQCICFADTFAFALPAQTIGHFLGVEKKEQAQFNRWIQFLMLAPSSMASGLLSFPLLDVVNSKIDRFFINKLSKAKADSTPAHIYQWFHEQSVDGELTEAELLKLIRTLMFAGVVTVSCFISNTLRALHREPRLWEQIKSTPSKLPELLEESLRFDAPVPHSEQFTIREIEVGGIRIPPNQKVMAFIALANRDPDIFKAPHQFNPERQNANKHLSFGAGPHACLGAHLARMIATHLFISLSEQFSHFELQVGPNEIDWLATTFLRGPRKLPVRFYK